MIATLLSSTSPAAKSNRLKNALKTVCAAALLLCGVAGNAQVSSYTFSATTGSFTNYAITDPPVAPLTAITWPATASAVTWDDDVPQLINIGFTFNFNGTDYTTAYISPNGFLTFGSAAAANNYDPIASTATYQNAIALWSNNLKSNNVAIKYLVGGAAPSRTLTIEWVGFREGTTAGTMYARMVLNESAAGNARAGYVDMYYKNISGAVGFKDGQIGLRGVNNTDFKTLNYTATAAWPALPYPTATFTVSNNGVGTATNADRVRISGNLHATPAGRWFTFAPPTCWAPRTITATPQVGGTTVNLSWPVVASATNGYDYYITTTVPTDTGSLPGASTTPTGSTATSAANSVTAGGLTDNTLYYVYVRSKCGAASGWSAAFSFTTLCGISPVPYIENFNMAPLPAQPVCTVVDTNPNPYTSATQGTWVSSNQLGSTATELAFNTRHMRIQSPFNTSPVPPPNDSWWISKGINLVAGTSYKLTYTYGSGSQFTYTSQELAVWLMNDQSQYGGLQQFAQHSLLKDGPYTNVVNFTVPINGVYYIGFNDNSMGNMGITLLDDVSVELSTCFPPTLIPPAVLASGTATINWNAASPVPGSGYQYYYSTINNPPSNTGPVTGTTNNTSVTITGLTGGLTYYFWVRSNCGGNDYSSWSALPPFIATGPTPASCNPSGAGYFQDPLGITNVTFANVNNTTGLESNNYGDYAYIIGYAALGSTLNVSVTYRTGFTYDTLIWVDWNKDGDFLDANEQVIPTSVSSPAGNPSTLTLSFLINPAWGAAIGQEYRMRIGGIDSPIFTGGALTPCRTGAYQAFEDYTLHVTTTPLPLTLSATSATICAGATSGTITVSSTHTNYNNYTWSPAGTVSGTLASGYTFNPTTTTVYTLEAVNTSNFTRRSVTFTVYVNPAPSAVTVTPANATVCQNATTAVALTASGGLISDQTIYAESFNGSATGWTQTNTTTGANAESAAWALFADGYSPFGNAIHSNDNSQFAFTESDAPGSGTTTHTTLLSPPINLTGYSSVTLSFWEFYQMYQGDSNDEYGLVEIRTLPSGAWTTLINHDGTANVGTYNNWVNQTFTLAPAFLNQTVEVRFTYHATYDWGWGIDNFRVAGSAPAGITWAPTTGLYTTAAMTTAYTGGSAATVYAAPTSNQNYVATATFSGCPTNSAPVPVTVTPISGGTLTAASQVGCGTPANITLTGVVGTILYWQSADDAAFTVNVTTVAGSAGQNPLLGTTIGTLSATKYFRAVVSVGGCSNAYSPVHTINVSSSTWDGLAWSNGVPTPTTSAIFTGNYTISANTTYCAITVQNGATVTVNSGVTLTVTNSVNVSTAATPAHSNLVFLNNASLIQTTNAVNSGDIKYYRNTTPMRAYDYTYWSSPVNGQIVGKVSPLTLFDKYFWFNTTTYQWTSIAAPGTTVMTPGRGYIIRAPQGYTTTPQVFSTHFGFDDTVHSGGTPNNGTIVLPVTRNATPANNLECIGNPYPSALSANLLMSNFANAATLGNGTTLYFWTHNTPITALNYAPNDYASYNYTGGVGTGTIAGNNGCPTCNNAVPNGNIASGQGFMVTLKASGNITFNNSMRLSGSNNQFFKQPGVVDAIESLERNRFWLELTNTTGLFKQALVGYVEGATNAVDEGYDGEVAEAGNPVSLYTLNGDTKLTIQGRALPFVSSDVVPLGYRSNAAGTFTLTLADTDGLFEQGQDVYLEDKAVGFLHNLSIAPYTFATEGGTFNDRFEIKYLPSGALATQVADFSEQGVVVYKNNRDIHVETSNVTIKEVRVFDLRGREIAVKSQVNDTKAVLNNLDAAQQVLLVQVTSTDNRVVTKKIIF